MGRPEVISRDQILTAARELFLKEGASVSTASIAKLAGVSEGSIFKRFPTKEALFRAALGLPDLPAAEEIEARLASGTLEEGLESVGLWLIGLFREALPRMMMLWANHTAHTANPFETIRRIDGVSPMPLVLLRALSHGLERLQREDKLRDSDPEIMARMLIGSMHNFVFFELVGVHAKQPLAASSFVRAVVDLLLRGAGTESEK